MDILITKNGEQFHILEDCEIHQTLPEFNNVAMLYKIRIKNQSGTMEQISLGGSWEMCIQGLVNQGFQVSKTL